MDKIAIVNRQKDMYNIRAPCIWEVIMYKLLLATDQEVIRQAFQEYPWNRMGFHAPLIVSSTE